MLRADKKFLLLWLFNPFMSGVYLFRNFKHNSKIGPYLLLSLFFGLSFVISTTGGDSQRYAMELIEYERQNLTLAELFDNLYTDEGKNIDIYQPLITWIVSKFTTNTKVLFVIFSLVFGYFYFKSLIIIRSKIEIPLRKLTLLLFLLLAFTNPIWNINGVRMWTAIGIFFYGILLLDVEKMKKGWIFLFLSLFVHFTLVLPLIVYIIHRVFPIKSITLLFAIYLGTLFMIELDVGNLKKYFLFLPDFLQQSEAYLNEEYIEKVEGFYSEKSLFYKLSQQVALYVNLALASLMFYYLKFQNKTKDNTLKKLYVLALIFLIFTNIISFMPSGGRFSVLSTSILLTVFILFQNKGLKIKPIIYLFLIPAILLVMLLKIRIGIETIGVYLFIGNPIINWFVEDVPIIEFLKNIF